MGYARKIYIEPETLEKARINAENALQALHQAIDNNGDIKALTADYLQKSRTYRAFLNANYHL